MTTGSSRAPSPGLLLKKVDELLLGADGFYDDIFSDLGVPYEAVQWRQDVNSGDHEETQVAKQMQVSTLINMYRVRGHLIADLDPLSAEAARDALRARPATYGLTIWDLDRQFLTGGGPGIYAQVGDTDRMALGDILHLLRDAYCRTVGIEYMHIQEPEEKRWIQEQVEGTAIRLPNEDQRHILGSSTEPRHWRSSSARSTSARSASGSRAPSRSSRSSTRCWSVRRTTELDSAMIGMPHRGRLNVLVNVDRQGLQRSCSVSSRATSIPTRSRARVTSSTTSARRARYASRVRRTPAGAPRRQPLHLEAVDPVVEGMARARMDRDPPRRRPAASRCCRS